ncbi:AAAP amino acid permease [Pseudozyma hubeiensis]|nr:AAAP amino acid permease [Pseudozyma hubeiensis]
MTASSSANSPEDPLSAHAAGGHAASGDEGPNANSHTTPKQHRSRQISTSSHDTPSRLSLNRQRFPTREHVDLFDPAFTDAGLGRRSAQVSTDAIAPYRSIRMSDLTNPSPIRQRAGKSKFNQPIAARTDEDDDINQLRPPSFAESQFATIIRRQRKRRIVSPTTNLDATGITSVLDLEASTILDATASKHQSNAEASGSDDPVASDSGWGRALRHGELKAAPGLHRDAPTTTLASDRQDPLMAIHRAWEFAGWGSISLLELPPSASKPLTSSAADSTRLQLGQWKASAIAGNAVTGSVFYALPAVVAVSSVMSPISIFIACLLLYPFRPIICELASALSASNAGNYSYLTNISSKLVAVLAAAITLLDAVATGAVSAGTASAYVEGEMLATHTHIDGRVISILLLVGLAALCLLGMRDSSSVALGMFVLHVVTMFMLIVAGLVAWIRTGNSLLHENWVVGMAAIRAPSTGKGVARAIFDGVCVAFVGLTGFECSPSYINQVKPGEFPKALRNLHIIVLLTEAPLMLLVLALVPMQAILSGANVLSLLGQVAGRGAWLKIFVVIDACLVLCGGIITGIVAFCGLVDTLCDDRVVPRALQRRLPKTGATYPSVALFLALTLVMSATCGFNLTTLSSVFSVSFLCVMTLFGVSLVLLKYARPSLPRSPIAHLSIVLLGIGTGITAMAGNFALSPVIIVQTLVYFVALAAVLMALAQRVDLARIMVWLVEHQRSSRLGRLSSRLEKRLIGWIRSERNHPVIYFTKSDDISVLANALYYIKRNEPTSKCKLVHCYKSIENIPEQLDETFQLVDEIFPTVTVDLVFVEAPFTPQVVRAITDRLGIPLSRSFISCPSGRGALIGSQHPLCDYGGLRIILP